MDKSVIPINGASRGVLRERMRAAAIYDSQ
jgi:hypothetical protein